MRVALTIDAEHPDRPATDPLSNVMRTLEVLRAHGVRATFFVQGSWAQAYPQAVRRIVDGGHLIGSHSHRHSAYTGMHRHGIVEDLQASRQSLAALGVDPGDWFRLPGGRGSTDVSVVEAVGACAFRHVAWTAMSGDWHSGRTVRQVVDRVLADVERRRPDGVSVPVFHSWPDPAPLAIGHVLQALDGSVRFVTLDRLDPGEVPWV